MTFAPGETVGPYRVIEQIGLGGMATVFKAYHAALDRFVALKVLHPVFSEDTDFLARFHREARIIAKLDHPNIIPIYDSAEEADTPYLVIRFVEGKTLKQRVSEGPLPIEEVLTLMRPIAAALAYAHSQGVVHRDIKPSNIIIGSDGRTYLTDFGLARIMHAVSTATSQDVMIGTPQYISPEQAKGETVDARSDIYSLGVVLFEVLTGRVPFSADTPYAVIHDQIYTPTPLPSLFNPKISPGVELVLLKSLKKDPAARFASASELFDALERGSGPASPTPQPSAVPEPQKDRGIVLRSILTVIGLLLFLGIVFALVNRPATPEATAGIAAHATDAAANSLTLTTPLPPVTVEAIATSLPAAAVPIATPAQIIAPAPSAPTAAPPTQTLMPPAAAAVTPTLAVPPRMVLVPPGLVWMGASPFDGQAAANEKPAHLVDESAFYIDQYEVTNAAYAQCVAAGVCLPPKGIYSPQSPEMAFGKPGSEDLPVVFVTQGMASQYCIWLGKRLPFEAEWEKAARGSDDQRIYPWGNTWEGEKANAGQTNPHLMPATTYAPLGCSPLGVCNMSGNAAEWIADYYGANFYADSIRNIFAPSVIHDPVNWDSGSGRFTIRGGSFRSNPFDVRISRRDALSGFDVGDDLGFRCARSVYGP